MVDIWKPVGLTTGSGVVKARNQVPSQHPSHDHFTTHFAWLGSIERFLDLRLLNWGDLTPLQEVRERETFRLRKFKLFRRRTLELAAKSRALEETRRHSGAPGGVGGHREFPRGTGRHRQASAGVGRRREARGTQDT